MEQEFEEKPENSEEERENTAEEKPVFNEPAGKKEWNKIFEASLFMSPNALNISDLMRVVGSEDYTDVKNSVLGFLAEFNARKSGIEIQQIDDSFKMQVRAEFEPRVSAFASDSLFHPGIMKTLALISFKQPIMQSAVIKYRNNKAYDHIAKLVLEGFVAREQKGRSFVLRTTKKFLEYFGTDFKKQQKTL